MGELDSLIEKRLVMKDKRYKMKKLSKVFLLLFVVLMVLLAVSLYVFTHQEHCRTITNADILDARQLYYDGDLTTPEMQQLLVNYFQEICV